MQLWNIPEQRELISKIKADGHTANQTIKADKNKQNLKNAFFFYQYGWNHFETVYSSLQFNKNGTFFNQSIAGSHDVIKIQN